jgi:hypothetical protein
VIVLTGARQTGKLPLSFACSPAMRSCYFSTRNKTVPTLEAPAPDIRDLHPSASRDTSVAHSSSGDYINSFATGAICGRTINAFSMLYAFTA